MIILYNFLQIAALVLLFPLLVVLILIKEKYRLRILKRLGIGLSAAMQEIPDGSPRIWIHALSVGEVSSAVSLVHAVRESFPEAVIFLSAATSSGEKFARSLSGLPVDLLFSFPLDIHPVVKYFIRQLRPDLFILVETDFWPNFLHTLSSEKVPSLLVNGRISEESYKKYRSFQPFFLPMFRSFTFLSMQRQEDVVKMVSLGVAEQKMRALGNLKYDAVVPDMRGQILPRREDLALPHDKTIIIAGSTHSGEEKIICEVFQRLISDFPDLFLIIAPRNIERSNDIFGLVTRMGFYAVRRSEPQKSDMQVLLVDTMGELAGLYGLADIAVVGGSFADFGGHNPLEPAAWGTPVVFGPYMYDFADIARDMLDENAAMQAASQEELRELLYFLLEHREKRMQAGRSAQDFIALRQGVTKRHIELMKQVLP
ncbi:MAG: 3-deoxy-D-manno-octulosonic acid transferase [Desulfobulbaceae bacterium]|nr:3-deoxy-D-manno-octulosonic acid transferase [Desulfobulbaceae bacterium]